MSWFEDDLEVPSDEPKWVKVGPLDRFAQDRTRVVFAGVTKVAVLRRGDEFYAFKNSCPHAGGSLGLGEIQGTIVSCPRPDWRFDIADGRCLDNAIYELRRYRVEVRADEVWVEV